MSNSNKQKHIDNVENFVNEKRQTSLRQQRSETPVYSAQLLLEHQQWYMDLAKQSLKGSFFALIALCISFVLIVFLANREPIILSYIQNSNGSIIKLQPTNNPTLSDTELLNWSAERIRELHTLSFSDYKDHLRSLRRHFHTSSFNEYQEALLSSKTIAKLKEGQLNMYIEPLDAPKITDAGVVNGVYTWVVEMKILQSMGGGETSVSGRELVSTMVVKRTPRTNNIDGVMITKYLVKEVE